MILQSSTSTIIRVPIRPDGVEDYPALMTVLSEAMNLLTTKLPEEPREIRWSAVQNGDFVDLTVRWRSSA